MQIVTKNTEFQTNVSNEHSFKIEANAKMFEILYSKIYSHKIPAIIRELTCNALDSHVEAGKSHVPFSVVLPHEMYPYFEVEDYGIGLDHHGVMEIYTSYGTSTKTGTNDLIGGLGLGSKTPFSYTDMFTVRARKDGVERIYNAFIGSNGAPMVNLMLERETEEGNGLQIKIPVKPRDFDSFKDESEFILAMFLPRPDITCSNHFSFAIPESTIEDLNEKGITVTSEALEYDSDLYGDHSLFAVMGTVCYPFSINDIVSPSINDCPHFHLIKNRDTKSTFFFKFDIGDLDVSASRESLSFESSGETAEKLSNVVVNVLNSMLDEDQNYIDSCTHITQVVAYLNRYVDMSVIGYYQNGFLEKLNYKGKKIIEYASSNNLTIFNNLGVHEFINSDSYYARKITHSKGYISRSFLQFIAKHGVEDATEDDKLHIVYNESGKSVGLIKESRKICSSLNRYKKPRVLGLSKPITKLRRERIERFLGIDIVWHNLDEIRAENKVARVKRTGASTGNTKPRVIREKDKLYAAGVSFCESGWGKKLSTQTLIEDPFENYSHIFYYDFRDEDLVEDDMNEFNPNRMTSYTDSGLSSLIKWIIRDKVLFVRRQKSNEKIIDELKIPSFMEFAETIKASKTYMDRLKYRQCIRNNHVYVNSWYEDKMVYEFGFADKLVSMLYEAGSPIANELNCQEIIDNIMNRFDPSSSLNLTHSSDVIVYETPGSDVQRLLKLDDNEVADIISLHVTYTKAVSNIKQRVYEEYPLLELLVSGLERQYYTDAKKNTQLVIDYLKSVDSDGETGVQCSLVKVAA